MPRESDHTLDHRAQVIYHAMNFIFQRPDLDDWFDRQLFCDSVAGGLASCEEILALAVEQGWIETSAAQVRITAYGRDYERKYWGTFR